MPKLQTPDGAELDEAEAARQFAQAMAAPEPDEPQAPAPSRTDTATGDYEAPVETRADNKARTRPSSSSGAKRGRPKGSGKKPAESATLPEGTFVQPVAEFLESLVVVGSVVPIPNEALKVKARLQANLVAAHLGGLAGAIDAAARHNAVIRKGVESLTMGASGWVLPAVLAVAPFAAQSAGLWRSTITEEMAKAAEITENAMKARLQSMGQQAETEA